MSIRKFSSLIKDTENTGKQERTNAPALSHEIEESLRVKAEESQIEYEVVVEVYNRGLNEWTEETNKTSDQYAFNRVNSFINGGLARKLDSDLLENNEVDISGSGLINEKNIMGGTSGYSDPAKYVSVSHRPAQLIQRHSQREKSMYHTSRTKEVVSTTFKTRGKKDPHLTNKHGDQLTDRITAERRKRVSQLRDPKNIGEHIEYLENRKAIHDAHADSARTLAGRERDPELRRIDLHRSKKHEHASRVIDRLLDFHKKRKK